MNINKQLPISEYQQRFFLEWAMDPEGNTYNVAFVYKIIGNLDVTRLIQACEAFITNHEIYHAKYNEDGSNCYFGNYLVKDFFHQYELNPDKDIYLQLRDFLNKPFNLTKDALLRFILLKNKLILDEYYLIGPFAHHIVIDGAAGMICVKEISETYNSLNYKIPTAINKTFTDAVRLEQQLLNVQYKQNAKEYWLNFIGDFPLSIGLPYKPKLNSQDLNSKLANKKGNFIYFALNEIETKSLKEYARQNKSTLFIVLSAIYGLIISKYSNQSKLLLSYPINMRPKGYTNVTGCFVNNVPLKLDLDQNETLDELISNLTIQRKEIKDFQGYSLTDIIEDQRKYNNVEINNFFNVGFSQTSLNTLPLVLDNLKVSTINIPWNTNVIHELDLLYDELAENSIQFKLEYREALFDEALIESLVKSFKSLITKTINAKVINCKTYCVLDIETYNEIIYQFNNIEKPHTKNKNICQLFQEQVTKTPDNIAIVYEDIKITYKALNDQSNQLANYLKAVYQIKGDDLVAICLDRNEYILIAILGVLKSGGAYVPIDRGYPDDRIDFILHDTQAKVLITNSKSPFNLSSYPDENILALDDNNFRQILNKYSINNPETYIKNSNLAYIIYTSGTTGKPKGVMIEHQQLYWFIQGFLDKVLQTENGRFNCLSMTNYVFDIFGLEYIVPLIKGDYVELINLNNFLNLACKIEINKYDYIQLTPSKIDLFLEQISIKTTSKKRVVLLIGGEALRLADINLIYKHENNNIKFDIYNVYGPTETTIWSTYCKLDKDHDISIGKPLPNEKIYILDNFLSPVPKGVTGQLYISGVGVARGYLNQLQLTNERFLPNMFQTENEKQSHINSKLYKTGDLVRMWQDGSIEYIERNDSQIKIRGYRIEPGEIEQIIMEYKDIANAVVKTHFNNITQQFSLIAYYTIKNIDKSNLIKDWEDVYEKEYSKNLSVDNYKLNINLWVSSFTKQVIPRIEMEEWVNSTNARIKDISYGQVLEVGCGSGLILFNIIDSCKYYYATDFSKSAIAHIDMISKKHGFETKLETIVSSADQLRFIGLKDRYNTIIINSVVQYFPSVEYLEDLILKAIENAQDKSVLFIGDVRDFRLLDTFHYVIATYNSKNIDKAEILRSARFDNELLISPHYFIRLKNKLKNITHIDILAKYGQAEHEMNRFRYDVVIYIDKNSKANINSKNSVSFDSTTNLSEYLEKNTGNNLFIRYPNKRVYADYARWNELHSGIKAKIPNSILSINEIFAITIDKQYITKILLDPDNPGYLLIILTKSNHTFFSDEFNYLVNNELLSNNPSILSHIQSNNLEQKIFNLLREKLPEYMIPDTLVHLQRMPLTANGKLDIKALPNPVFINAENEYIAPRNEMDKLLIQIFASILGFDLNQLSIAEDFFRLGGNSILAIKLINQINKSVKVTRVNVTDIFTYKTIEKLSDYISCQTNQLNYEHIAIKKYNRLNQEDYKLSFAQERLWFIDNLQQGTNAYNIPIVLKLSKNINKRYLFQALENVVNRHEILRSVIKEDINANAYQKVLELNTKLLINEHTYVNVEELYKNLAINCNYIFKLDREYPIKIDFYQNINEIFLAIVINHIAFDGWSIDILLNEVTIGYKYYQELGFTDKKTKVQDLPTLAIQYKDYALWQRAYLNETILSTQLNYWKNQLSGYENIHLTTDKQRPLIMDYIGANEYFNLGKDISTKLRNLSKDLGISLYSILLGSYYFLLSIYTNQTDLVIGTPIANRHYTDLEDIIGPFVNTLAIRVRIDKQQLVTEYLNYISEKIIEAHVYQDLPFEILVDNLDIEKDGSRHPIFQIMFSVQSFGRGHNLTQAQYSYHDNPLFEYQDMPFYTVAKFDLTSIIDDSGHELTGIFNYRTSLYNKDTIQNLIKTYIVILKNIISSNEQTKLNQVGFLNKKDYYNLVTTYNQTKANYPQDKTIHQLFEEQVIKNPDNIAIIYKNIQLTYTDLNYNANQLAYYLRSTYKIQGDDLICLCLHRNELMIIAILAVLKSGGAYVPIDPNYPADRINFILNDTQAKLTIADSKSCSKLECFSQVQAPNHSKQNDSTTSDTLIIDNDEFINALKKYPKINLEPNITSSNLAYVIYTSGTTGKPKGVMIEHRNALNTIFSLQKLYFVNTKSKVSFFTAYVFDVSVIEIFASLTSSCELHVFPEDIRHNADEISNYLLLNKINVCYLPPVLLSLIKQQEYPDLINIIYAGECCDYVTGKYWSLHKNLYNYYGPTETSIYCLGKQVLNGDINLIGIPLENTTCYILDNELNVLPVGAIGELYIGGVGVGRGYLNLPELTKERFLNNPFQNEIYSIFAINSRIYKTGDLVRMLPDGNIEYIGRNDFQLKIRGYRIEPGEIEFLLIKYPEITQAVVLVLDHPTQAAGAKYLVAYYVARLKLNEKEILNYLHQKLPNYMVPNIFIHLNKLPVNINGKLDKKLLPKHDFIDTYDNSFLAARNKQDKILVKIFADILDLKAARVSISKDFFKIGGNSILAIKLISKINKQITYIKLTVADIFKYKTIEKISDYISTKDCSKQSLVHLLNDSLASKLLFMIHPGMAGCEVYFELASLLTNHYKCYGIDNYNIHNTTQISSLYELANLYLSYIEEIRLQNNIKPDTQYNLLGWSLGGQIALAIASLLETRGITNINIICLDTFLMCGIENKIIDYKIIYSTPEYKKQLYELAYSRHNDKLPKKYKDQSNLKSVLIAMDSELLISHEIISPKLSNTYILLFKAIKETKINIIKQDDMKKLSSYMLQLPNNNFEHILVNNKQLKTISLECEHYDILKLSEEISMKITDI